MSGSANPERESLSRHTCARSGPPPVSLPNVAALALATLLALSFPSTVRAGDDDRRPDVRLGIQELRLDNGLEVLLVERPDSPDVAAGWVVRSGSADDPATARGLAHLLEHLMFKGTKSVGTRDWEAEERLLRQLDETRSALEELRRRGRTSRAAGLEERLRELEEERRRLLRPGELSLLYSEAGASGLNAYTFEDFSLYFVRLPPGKLELWFWLEADRLRQPVFRHFSRELEIIRQEVGQRVDSAPTGHADGELRRRFWGNSSYAWRPLGEVADLTAMTPAAAEAFFRDHYTPPNLTAVLVGRFDPSRAAELAPLYFGPLKGPPAPRRDDVSELPDHDQPLRLECDCPMQARIRYPTVPFRHEDSYALQVVAGLLNGRTGRLYRSLVLDQGIAFSAAASQISYRRAGFFQFSAETRGDVRPVELVAAWDRELERLLAKPPAEAELRRVKNQLLAESLRALRRPADLARQLLIYAGLGNWRQIEDWPRRIDGVTAADVHQTGVRYLTRDRRLVTLYHGSGETATGDGGGP